MNVCVSSSLGPVRKLCRPALRPPHTLFVIVLIIKIPYARHYNPRFVLFLPHFSFSLRFILQTIYVLKTKILHFLSLKTAVYIRERFLIHSVWQNNFKNCILNSIYLYFKLKLRLACHFKALKTLI